MGGLFINNHGTPEPSFLGLFHPYIGGEKILIFHDFGSKENSHGQTDPPRDKASSQAMPCLHAVMAALPVASDGIFPIGWIFDKEGATQTNYESQDPFNTRLT